MYTVRENAKPIFKYRVDCYYYGDTHKLIHKRFLHLESNCLYQQNFIPVEILLTTFLQKSARPAIKVSSQCTKLSML